MAVLCGMPTIQYSTRSARLSVRLSKWAWPKITSGQTNLTFDIRSHHWCRRTVQSYSPGGANMPSHVGTLVPPGVYDWNCVYWRHLANTTELVLPSVHPMSIAQTANRSVQPFLHSSQQKVPLLYNVRSFPKRLPLAMRDLDLTHNSLGQSEPIVQTASRSVQPFSHRWPQSECPYTLQRTDSAPQNCPFRLRIWIPI